MNHELLVWLQDHPHGRVSFSRTKGGQYIACLKHDLRNEDDCRDGIGGDPETALTDVLAIEAEVNP